MICHHGNAQIIIHYEKVSIYKCPLCHLIYRKKSQNFINPQKLYSTFYKNEISGRFHFGIEYVIRLFRFFRAFKLFTINQQAKTILDIGSGRGFTLYYLKKYYHYREAVGTQLCNNAVEFSRRKLGLTIHDKDLLKINFKGQRFETITMWHVLEHVTQPEKYVRKINKLLANKGMFIIEVPNFDSWTSKICGKYWLGLDLRYHLTFFTRQSLIPILKRYKFRIVDVHTFSLEYSTFISVQSLTSKLTGTDQYFFKWLQTKQKFSMLVLHLIIFSLLTPICLIVNILMYYSKHGEVLLITAQKRS